MVKRFTDYAEVKEECMEGYTVAHVTTGINAEETGMLFEIEKGYIVNRGRINAKYFFERVYDGAEVAVDGK